MLPRIDPRISCLTTLSITHCSKILYCLLLPTCLCLSSYIFLHFYIVPGQLNSLFLIVEHVLSVSLVTRHCSIVCFKFICHFSDYTLYGHVTSLNLPFFHNLSCLIFVKCVSAFNLLLIYPVTDKNA